MKVFSTFALSFAVVVCANAQEPKGASPAAATPPPPAAAPAASACAEPKPAPKELVKKDLAPGDGKPIEFRDAALVNYTGWFYDGCAADLKGAQFDTSRNRSTPFGFVVGAGRVIKGWDEGVLGMKEQGKRLLVIPPDKAYGEKGTAGGKIPPNSTLVFEVEVVKVLDTKQGAPVPPAPSK